MRRKKEKSETNSLDTPAQRRVFISQKIRDAMSEVSKKESIAWHLESPEITAQGEVFNEAMTLFVEGKANLETVRDEYRKYVDLHRQERLLV